MVSSSNVVRIPSSPKSHTAVALAKRLGIESQLIQTNEEYRRSFIVRDGRLRAVPEGFQLMAPSRMWPFITSDIFSIRGKGADGGRFASAAQEHEWFD